MKKKRHVVIGSSAAGIGALSKLRKLAPDDEIICVTAQDEMPYNTCLLADFLSENEEPRALYTKDQSFFEKNAIELHRSTRINYLDPKRKLIMSETGKTFHYDTLFIGTGMKPYSLQETQAYRKGLLRFHTLHDTEEINAYIETENPETALVVGAGLSGIECADALVERGIKVTIIEQRDQILPFMVPQDAANAIEYHLHKHGVNVVCSNPVDRILYHPDTLQVGGVILANDDEFLADMIIQTVGAAPVIDFAAQAGAAIHNRCIVVDKQMRTNIPDVYAGGDVVAAPSLADGSLEKSCTWPDAVMHGMLAAHAMTGNPRPYKGLLNSISSIFFDTQFVSCGRTVVSEDEHSVIEHEPAPGYYQRYVLRNGILCGFTLVGKIDRVGELRNWIATKRVLNGDEKFSLFQTLEPEQKL